MYFQKQTVNTFGILKERTYLFAQCSRGKITLQRTDARRRSYNSGHVQQVIKVEWYWTVEFTRKNKGMKLPPSHRYHRVSERASGQEPTLYRAAQAALQRLFSQRKQPVVQLMNMLIKDQVMWELSQIGG